MSAQEIHIGLNRRRLIVNVAVSAVLGFAALIGLFWIADHQEAISPVFYKTIGGIVFGFCVIIGGTHSKRLAKKNAGLTLTKEGLLDQSSSIAVGLVRWKDMKSIQSAKTPTSKLLLIEVKRPDDVVKNAKNKAIKRLMQQNVRLYKTPIVINAKILDASFEELELGVSEYYNRFAKK